MYPVYLNLGLQSGPSVPMKPECQFIITCRTPRILIWHLSASVQSEYAKCAVPLPHPQCVSEVHYVNLVCVVLPLVGAAHSPSWCQWVQFSGNRFPWKRLGLGNFRVVSVMTPQIICFETSSFCVLLRLLFIIVTSHSQQCYWILGSHSRRHKD
jgi:hypothetical protein